MAIIAHKDLLNLIKVSIETFAGDDTADREQKTRELKSIRDLCQEFEGKLCPEKLSRALTGE
jgi:hypothetical protein